MNPLGTRARAEELAALLDGAVAGPGTLTAPYAGLAVRLRALAPTLEAVASPSADFRAALRQRLVAVATVQGAAPTAYAEPSARPLAGAVSWTQSHRAQRRIGVAAGAMASVVALTGVGVASTRSLPGQPFYGVKRFSEGIQLDLASGDTAKGTKHFEFAATRLREVKALAHDEGSLSLGTTGTPVAAGLGGSKSDHIAQALRDFDQETRAGSALLTKVFEKTGKPAPLRLITSFTTQQRSRLSALLPSLPTAVQDQAESSLQLVASVGTEATGKLALGTCGGACYPGNAGPALPAQPEPTPGATATPSDPADNNGVPGCSCGEPTLAPSPTEQPAPQDTPSSEPTPTPTPTETPTDEPSPSPSPSPSESPLLPVPLPTLPVPLPTLPVPLPTLPVPAAVVSPLPTLPVLQPKS